MNNVSGGFNDYCRKNGLIFRMDCMVTTNSGQKVIDKLNDNVPGILGLHNNNCYGNHYVLALGYMQFCYTNSTSNYIRIEDGWLAYPNRYVWGDCDGWWSYICI
ncbi:MAG: hypothetical protein PUC65_13495 [Clostridiales bacterium]|nr:hypothetical protein [Clostridiales bacterium]